MCYKLDYSEEQLEELEKIGIPIEHTNKEKKAILNILDHIGIGDCVEPVSHLLTLQKIDEDTIRVIQVLDHYLAEHLVNIFIAAGEGVGVKIETRPHIVKSPFELDRTTIESIGEWLHSLRSGESSDEHGEGTSDGPMFG